MISPTTRPLQVISPTTRLLPVISPTTRPLPVISPTTSPTRILLISHTYVQSWSRQGAGETSVVTATAAAPASEATAETLVEFAARGTTREAAPSTSGTTRTADACASADSRETATASAARATTIGAHETSATIVTETVCAKPGTLATGAGFAVALSLLRSATPSTSPAVKTRIVCRVVSTLVPSVARIEELASTGGATTRTIRAATSRLHF